MQRGIEKEWAKNWSIDKELFEEEQYGGRRRYDQYYKNFFFMDNARTQDFMGIYGIPLDAFYNSYELRSKLLLDWDSESLEDYDPYLTGYDKKIIYYKMLFDIMPIFGAPGYRLYNKKAYELMELSPFDERGLLDPSKINKYEGRELEEKQEDIYRKPK